MKPICVPCQRFFRVKRNGVSFIEATPVSGSPPAKPGTAEPDRWTPYKLWVGDLYECHGCGAQIISGVGHGPVAEHYMPEFQALVRTSGAKLQVNDC